MKETTLCYLERDGKYLMLYRNKKPQDPNEGKWIGVGGKLEDGESPAECLVREVREETGLELTGYEYRGKILFLSDLWEDEMMYLYTSEEFDGEMKKDCEEGELRWFPFEEIAGLNLWEGDRIFLRELMAGKRDIRLTLKYEGEKLVSVQPYPGDIDEGGGISEMKEEAGSAKPTLSAENVDTLFECDFLRLYDLRFSPGTHYYEATRRRKEDLVALKPDEEFRRMLPDAVGCVVIVKAEGSEPMLCLCKEFRYPSGQFLLGVPAGLLDEADRLEDNPVFCAAIRELFEETGICFGEGDEIRMINPFLFSSPGMTDESNAMVQIVINRETLPVLSKEGSVGGEYFEGYRYLSRAQATEILRQGTDAEGYFYSVYTWIALMCFVSDLWE